MLPKCRRNKRLLVSTTEKSLVPRVRTTRPSAKLHCYAASDSDKDGVASTVPRVSDGRRVVRGGDIESEENTHKK